MDMGPKQNDLHLLYCIAGRSGTGRVPAGWGSSARFGAINPEQEPFRTQIERADVTVVDLTKLRAGDALHHGKFAECPEVVRLIGRRLAEGQDVSGSRIGLGDRIIELTAGTAAAVGTAAGLAVSAPVAIIDQQTRESLR